MYYDTYSPSPEDLYIRNETVFIRVLKEYSEEKRSIGDVISAYLTIFECGFNMPSIKLQYEKVIDEKFESESDIPWWLDEKEEKSFKRLKERYDILKQGRQLHKTNIWFSRRDNLRI